jgi:UDP-3-O-[3-hydroxymyristoyl] glucosamine N-acyltransferase
MSEPLFFKPERALTVGEIATLTGAEPRPATDLARIVSNIAPLDRAGPGDLTFLDNAKFAGGLAATRASACLVVERFEKDVPDRVGRRRRQSPAIE